MRNIDVRILTAVDILGSQYSIKRNQKIMKIINYTFSCGEILKLLHCSLEIKVYLSNLSSVEKRNKVITCEGTPINLSSIDTIIPYSYDLIDEITSHNNFPILYHLIYLKISLKTSKTKEIT